LNQLNLLQKENEQQKTYIHTLELLKPEIDTLKSLVDTLPLLKKQNEVCIEKIVLLQTENDYLKTSLTHLQKQQESFLKPPLQTPKSNNKENKPPVSLHPPLSSKLHSLEHKNDKLIHSFETLTQKYQHLQKTNQEIRKEYDQNLSQLKSLELDHLKSKHLLASKTSSVNEQKLAELQAQVEFEKNEKEKYRKQRNKLIHLIKTNEVKSPEQDKT